MEQQSLWHNKIIHLLVAGLLLAGIIALGSYALFAWKQTQNWMSAPIIISVSGTAELVTRPDIGTFSFAVRAEGSDASEAQSLSAESINSILAYLEEAGVEEVDVKTENYNLNPRYRYEERICIAGQFCGPGEQVLDGYEVYQNVRVKVRDLEAAGTLISGVGERGATNISSLSFTIDDTDVLEAEARALAIVDAKAKAKILADDLGVRIVRMANYYESEGGENYSYDMPMMERAMFSDEAIAPELPVGENTISAQVQISYEVK